MTAQKKAADLLKKHNGHKEHALVTVAENLRIGKKLKNDYLVLYYEQVKQIIDNG